MSVFPGFPPLEPTQSRTALKRHGDPPFPFPFLGQGSIRKQAHPYRPRKLLIGRVPTIPGQTLPKPAPSPPPLPYRHAVLGDRC